MCAYFRLECGVEVCEEGVLPGEGQHSFLDHGTLHIIIHEDYILLQSLDSKVLPLPLQLCQQHLRCQRLGVRASSPIHGAQYPPLFGVLTSISLYLTEDTGHLMYHQRTIKMHLLSSASLFSLNRST